jgi:capsular polysaccharide transport system ATP-binding protein
MIILDDVTIGGGLNPNSRQILTRARLVLPSDRRIALLGPSVSDKQIFLKVLAGAVMPTAGQVIRRANVSFPVGQLPGFSRQLTVRVNIAHVARLYGADIKRTLQVVEASLKLGSILDRPYERMPKRFRQPLAQVVAFAIPFDVYLLTNHRLSVPKESDDHSDMASECYALFAARARTAGMIIPTNNKAFIRRHCDMAVSLDAGRLEIVDLASLLAARGPPQPRRAPRIAKKRR